MSTRKPTFDFNQAVASARRDYPEETQGIIFVDGDNNIWDMDAASADCKKAIADNPNDPVYQFVQKQQGAAYATFTHTAGDKIENYQLLVLKRTHLCADALLNQHPAFSNSDYLTNAEHSFNHELGHLIVRGGTKLDKTLNGKPSYREYVTESIADTFDSLHNAKKSFIVTIEESSFARVFEAWISHNISHLSTMALDKLIVDSKTTDFVSLTPQEIKHIAEEHGKKYTLTREEHDRVEQGFFSLPKTLNTYQDHARALIKLTLEAPSDSLTFYMGARILSGIFKRESMRKVYDIGKDAWDDVQSAIKSRAVQWGDLGSLISDFGGNKEDVQQTPTPQKLRNPQKSVAGSTPT